MEDIERYLVKRPQDEVEVVILPHKEDNKFSFVNFIKEYICPCKFDSIEEALKDMDNKINLGTILSYIKIDG